jgi:hypothetical protein
MSRTELVIGVLAGIALGLAIVAIFVFAFSEDTVDAPSLERSPPAHGPAGR